MAPDSAPTKRERRDAAREARRQREAAEAAAAARKRRLIQLGGLLAVAAVVVIVVIVASSGGGSKSSSDGSLAGASESQKMLAGIPQNGITLGKPNAPVTVVEFADPQCPFCKDYTLNEMPKIVQDYVRTGKAKMDLRLLTFIGPDSIDAAQTLLGAGQQDKLWNAADLFYYNQEQENSGYVDDAFLRKVLGGVQGLDVDQAMKASTSSQVTDELGAAKTLASRYGVDSTPTVLVGPTGGELKDVGGQAPTAESVGKAIEAALKAKGSSGT
ncbi:MAG TPA: thioredoxin domain-containing protein [Baekduia sp.]|nr:thioredoxin domain-containing protein [Baekduia sp.]